MTAEEFAAALKNERTRTGLNQTLTAVALAVPFRTYSDWERRHTTPWAIAQEGALARLAKLPDKAAEK